MAKSKPKKEPRKLAASNRRAFAKYTITETLEAGLALTGPEVKSLRAGKANLEEAFVRIDNTKEEAFLWNAHIAPYSMGSTHVEQEPTRTRKLLLKKSEIRKWMGRSMIKGLAIVPLEIYFTQRGFAKVKIALGKGKKTVDRRDDLKKKSLNREMRRNFAEKQKIR